jgi:hypothetical protein
MTVATQTLEGQLDALIAEHGLTALTLTRIARKDGTSFWAMYAQQDTFCGHNYGTCDGSVEAELSAALVDLNEKRTRPVVVPELAPMEQAA